jgi:hypothetical protein
MDVNSSCLASSDGGSSRTSSLLRSSVRCQALRAAGTARCFSSCTADAPRAATVEDTRCISRSHSAAEQDMEGQKGMPTRRSDQIRRVLLLLRPSLL